jgi:hypothetical protein
MNASTTCPVMTLFVGAAVPALLPPPPPHPPSINTVMNKEQRMILVFLNLKFILGTSQFYDAGFDFIPDAYLWLLRVP